MVSVWGSRQELAQTLAHPLCGSPTTLALTLRAFSHLSVSSCGHGVFTTVPLRFRVHLTSPCFVPDVQSPGLVDLQWQLTLTRLHRGPGLRLLHRALPPHTNSGGGITVVIPRGRCNKIPQTLYLETTEMHYFTVLEPRSLK